MSTDKTLPEGLQHLLAVIYVISNTLCIMQTKKGKEGGEIYKQLPPSYIKFVPPHAKGKAVFHYFYFWIKFTTWSAMEKSG